MTYHDSGWALLCQTAPFDSTGRGKTCNGIVRSPSLPIEPEPTEEEKDLVRELLKEIHPEAGKRSPSLHVADHSPSKDQRRGKRPAQSMALAAVGFSPEGA